MKLNWFVEEYRREMAARELDRYAKRVDLRLPREIDPLRVIVWGGAGLACLTVWGWFLLELVRWFR